MNTPIINRALLDYGNPAYLEAYRRINGLVIVGEAMADRHFRRLATLIPEDHRELGRLAAMEARHAADFVGCGRQLGVRADVGLAQRLLAPLHQQFRQAAGRGDLVSALVIQCLLIESIAVAAYRLYLPVADPYAEPITRAVLADEAEHLNYGETWLRSRHPQVSGAVTTCLEQALPVALELMQVLTTDLRMIGIDPLELLSEVLGGMQESLLAIGWTAAEARRLLTRLAARALS